jgi:large subunit ribosomal protein L23
MNLGKVIKKPIITEKSTELTSLGKYTFLVDKRAKKGEVARAVEKHFDVHVNEVWITRARGGDKKAAVQLAEGEKLDLFVAPVEKGGKKQ